MGREIAVAYGGEGASVVVNFSKSRPEAETTGETVRSAGGDALLVQADVARDDQVRAMVATTLDRYGRIDILVNNAGITHRAAFDDLEALTGDVWDGCTA